MLKLVRGFRENNRRYIDSILKEVDIREDKTYKFNR